MAHLSHEAQRSASAKQNATPSARQAGTLTDGYLSVRFTIRTDAHGRTDLFAQPQQQYDNGDGRTFHSPFIHQDDLFGMAMLLMKASGYARLLKKTATEHDGGNSSDNGDDSTVSPNSEMPIATSSK